MFGMKGQVHGSVKKQLAAENPKVYTPQYITKARSFMGKHCTDCSGLITWCTGILREAPISARLPWRVPAHRSIE